jgi:hypothetical chaperone protein
MHGKDIGIGIDFGTSNSAVAWFDGHDLQMIPLEESNGIMPTALHLNRDFQSTTGTDAVRRYVDENRGRRVEMVAEIIGTASQSAEESDAEPSNIYGGLVDRSLPGRLILGAKRLLGSKRQDTLEIFGKNFRLVALITPILLQIRSCINDSVISPINKVHIGRPVEFEGTNSLALERLTESSRYAGYTGISFFPEPVAATLSYLYSDKAIKQGVTLAVDFGGGTLDFSLIEFTSISTQNESPSQKEKKLQFNVIATSGIAMGGDHIDQLIFESLIFPLLGKGERWVRTVDGTLVDTPFPFQEYEQGLLNWAITHKLNQNQFTARLANCISSSSGSSKEKFERLRDTIQHNYSFNIFSAIKKAKAELSETEETVLSVPELDLNIPFRRNQLNAIINELMALIEEQICQLFNESEIDFHNVTRVVRTGGSSNIVAVINLLEKYFPGKVVQHDPFTSVAAGLAIANYFDYRADIPKSSFEYP